MSDTSQDRGLVDMLELRKLRILTSIPHQHLIDILVMLVLSGLQKAVQGVAHIKRLGKQDVLYMRLTLIEIIGDLCYIYAPM